MKQPITLLLFLGFYCLGFSQEYTPAYNQYYETEIAALKANYAEEDIKKDVSLLYVEWLVMVRDEQKKISAQGEPDMSKLKRLAVLEEEIMAGINGEPPKMADADSTGADLDEYGQMPDSIMSDSEPKAEVAVSDLKVVEEIPDDAEEKVVEVESDIETETTLNKDDEAIVDKLRAMYSSELEGVYYRIQVAATNKKKSGRQVQLLLNLKEEVIEEENDGFYKYLVGKFSKYTTAKAKAEELKASSGINAFVVGYKNNKRVSFSEIFVVD